MARLAVAAVIVIGLAAGVWWLWPREDPTGPSTTVPSADPITTTTPSPGETTTSTSEPGSHVVETVEEAEAILRDLWFGWFGGIYNQDEDRIREVVATEEQVDTAREQFGVMEFIAPPTREGLRFLEVEILRSDETCLAVWNVSDADSFLGPGDPRTGVDIVRRANHGWVFFKSWRHKGDLWAGDCEALLPSS